MLGVSPSALRTRSVASRDGGREPAHKRAYGDRRVPQVRQEAAGGADGQLGAVGRKFAGAENLFARRRKLWRRSDQEADVAAIRRGVGTG